MKFRKLRADEIECRVAQINKSKISLLLYKDARVDQRMLDEEVGPMRWQRKHEMINGNLFCSVGIKADDGEWIWKQDVGKESNMESEKGQASDAFKRACFNWGIGRELYTAPQIDIWHKSSNGDYARDKNGNLLADVKAGTDRGKEVFKCYDKFIVKQIGYDEEGNINLLAIFNKTQQSWCFCMDNRPKESADGVKS